MEFERPGPGEYEAVNERIGVDPGAGATNWPVGLPAAHGALPEA
jgi:hypothetical protein